MTSKQFNKLTDILTKVLEDKLEEDDVTEVLTVWKSQRAEVLKVFGKSAKSRKDPNAPKKPRSSYIFYCMDARAALVKKETELEPSQVMTRLGAMWKELTEKKKKKFVKMATEDKERYAREMEGYTPPNPEELEAAAQKKKKKTRSGPSRPMTSYLFFSSAMRPTVKEEMPELSGKEIMTELGARWRALSDEDKTPYVKMYEKDKLRYERELEESNTNDDAAEETPVAKKSKKKGKKKKAEPEDTEEVEPTPKKSKKGKKPKKEKPKKGSKKSVTVDKTPGYEVFVEEQSEELQAANPKWKSKRLTSEINKTWLALDDEERNAYEEEARVDADEDDSDVFDDSSDDDAVEEGA